LLTTVIKYFIQHKIWAVLIAIIWTALIFIACFLPGNEIPNVQIPMIDKWVHFVIFAGFSFLWYLSVPKATVFKSLLLIILSFLIGFIVELIQGSSWVVGRAYEVNDVIADGIGGILGVVLYIIIEKRVLKIIDNE